MQQGNTIDLGTFKPIAGDVLVEIHHHVENEVMLPNGQKLHLATEVKGDYHKAANRDMEELFDRMKRSRFKDKSAMKQYVSELAKVKVDEADEPYDQLSTQTTRRGKVKILPHKRGNFGNWDFHCDSGLEIGDEVWFDPLYLRSELEGNGDNKLYEVDGKKYVLIPEQAIYAAKRNDELISVNGYFLAKRLPNDSFFGNIMLLDSGVAKVEIVEVPKEQPFYRLPDIWKNTELKKGDICYLMEQFANPLDSTIARSTDLVRFQSRIVIAIEEN